MGFERRGSSGEILTRCTQCFAVFRAVEFERRGSSGDVFNAVYAAFRRSVSQRFEREEFEREEVLILNTPD